MASRPPSLQAGSRQTADDTECNLGVSAPDTKEGETMRGGNTYIVKDTRTDSERLMYCGEVVELAAKCGRIVPNAAALFHAEEEVVRLGRGRYTVTKQVDRSPVQYENAFPKYFREQFATEWIAMQHMFGVV